MCALGNRTDTCSGDSGGPIIAMAHYNLSSHRQLNYYYAVGITSIGPINCATPGMPAVYTRISYYMKWIHDIIRL